VQNAGNSGEHELDAEAQRMLLVFEVRFANAARMLNEETSRNHCCLLPRRLSTVAGRRYQFSRAGVTIW
jgi:hypothetical protein